MVMDTVTAMDMVMATDMATASMENMANMENTANMAAIIRTVIRRNLKILIKIKRVME